LNRTEPKTGSNRIISVRFGSVFSPSKPVQTQWSSTNTSNIPPSVLDHWPGLMWLLRKQYSSPKMLFCPPQTPYCCIICHLRCWNLNKKQAKHRPQLVIRKIGAFLQSLKKNKWKYNNVPFDKLFEMPATFGKQAVLLVETNVRDEIFWRNREWRGFSWWIW